MGARDWSPLDGYAATRVKEDQNDTPHPWCSPYKVMFGRPTPLIREEKGNLLQKGGMEVSWQQNNW